MEGDDMKTGFLLRLSDTIGAPEPAIRLLVSVLLGENYLNLNRIFVCNLFFFLARLSGRVIQQLLLTQEADALSAYIFHAHRNRDRIFQFWYTR